MTCSKCGENVTGFKEAWNDLHEKNKMVCIKESGLEEDRTTERIWQVQE